MARLPPAFGYLALVAVSFAAYFPLWQNDFIDLDDIAYVTGNANVKAGLSPESLRWAWTTYHAGYWHPLTWLSLQLDAELFSERKPGGTVLNAAAFHGTNWILHTATVLLLFALWRRMSGNAGASFLVAALFAVHPLHVESVAWAAERKDVLSTFLATLCLLAYVRYQERPQIARYFLVIVLFVLSLMAKPMHVTLPCVMLLLDYWPLNRLRRQARAADGSAGEASLPAAPRTRWVILEKVPLFLCSAGFSVLTVITQAHVEAVVPTDVKSLDERLANSLTAYGWYLWKTFWPLDLVVFYPFPTEGWPLGIVLLSAGLLVFFTSLACWQVIRRPWLFVGWFWFAGTLVPVIGLVQVGGQAFADRFSYWPHVGLFVALVWAGKEVAARLRVPSPVVAGLAAIILLLLSGLTWQQVGYWRDTPTVWQHALDVDPDNHRAHSNLGYYLRQQNQLALDREHSETALRLFHGNPDYHYNVGVVNLLLGNLDEAAKQFIETAIRQEKYSDAWYNLGVVRLRQGQTDKAIKHLLKALTLQPNSADALAMLGLAFWEAGKRPEAIESFQAALRYNPAEADALNGLGLAYLWKREYPRAAGLFRQAIQRNPGSVKAYGNLGLSLARQEKWQEASKLYEQAIHLQNQRDEFLRSQGGSPAPTLPFSDLLAYRCRLAYCLNRTGYETAARQQYDLASKIAPTWPESFLAQARKLATASSSWPGDLDLAYEQAAQTCQSRDDPPAEWLDALAIAAAAIGRFDEATVTGKKALAAAPRNSELAREIERRLKLFAKGERYLP